MPMLSLLVCSLATQARVAGLAAQLLVVVADGLEDDVGMNVEHGSSLRVDV
jgi:hypothetical protein